MIEFADVVFGTSYGDEGKGKIVAFLSSSGRYDLVARWAGGQNAGHTVWKGGVKFKTHIIPSGVFYGVASYIGPDCVLSPTILKKEIEDLKAGGIDVDKHLLIDERVHIVTEEHLAADAAELAIKLGTTSRGIAPAYAAKAARSGILASKALIGTEFEKYLTFGPSGSRILCEGAQAFYLDINHGNYPWVTSSSTLPYAAASIGFSPKKIRNIYAIAKAYETRSGVDPLFPESLLDVPDLLKIADAGKEYGTTTGRRRKVDYLNLDKLIYALITAGGTHLVINKCDILQEVNIFRLLYNNELINFNSLEEFKSFIRKEINQSCKDVENIYFSAAAEITDL